MFKKEDFKFGDLVTLENNQKVVYVGGNIVNDILKITISNYNDNLEYIYEAKTLNIKKIQRMEEVKEISKFYTTCGLATMYER